MVYNIVRMPKVSLSLTDRINVTRIFIVEGLLTTVVAVASKWLLADWPEQAKFLTDEERALLLAKLSKSEGVAKMDRLNRDAVRRILQDWKIWTGYDDPPPQIFQLETILKSLAAASCISEPSSRTTP